MFLVSSEVIMEVFVIGFLVLSVSGIYLSECVYVRAPGNLHYVHDNGQINTLAWSVKLDVPPCGSSEEDPEGFAREVAHQTGLTNHGTVGQLKYYYIFIHPLYVNESKARGGSASEVIYHNVKVETERRLDLHPGVLWFKQEVMRHRTKRNVLTNIKDPFFKQQWHLQNDKLNGLDMNVTGLWERNITGKGITVCVVDDGLEWTNPDLVNNYNPKGSWDLNDDDMDPSPSKDGAKNEHGTRCAGEIAAERNDFCGIGVAYEANISGIKVLDGKMTDSMEATAFNMHMEANSVYSCSWGPEDDGETIDGPHHLTSVAMEQGVNKGRNGYGVVYVVASGNGGATGDNCNFDGYANSVYTTTIGSVDEYGNIPYYAEECAAMLAVSLSSGGKGDRNIVTTDWTEVNGSGCTTEHTGTSAAAPLAAAIIAMMLQVRSCLTWRDIQYLIVVTSQKINSDFSDWVRNAAGLSHSNHHGFGLLSAWKLVSASKVWSSVPWMSTFSSGVLIANEAIRTRLNNTILVYNLTSEVIKPFFIWIMEYVRVRVTVSHPRRGHLELRLRCPSGSESILIKPRFNDKKSDGFNDWVFTTVRCWGEKPIGQWSLELKDHGKNNQSQGTIVRWELIIYGTPMTSSEFQSRIKLAKEAAEKNILDDDSFSLPCRPPLQHLGEEVTLSDKILQVLCFSGGFLFLLAVFETFEYIFCYDEEKKKFYEQMLSRGGGAKNWRRSGGIPDGTLESTPLIGEDENERTTCLEMLNHNIRSRYPECDLMEDDIASAVAIDDDISEGDNVLFAREPLVNNLSESST